MGPALPGERLIMIGSRLYRKNGFTFVEVLFSIGILLFVIVALLSILVNSSFTKDSISLQSIAVNACQAKIEEISNSVRNMIVATYNNQQFAVAGLIPHVGNGRIQPGLVTVRTIAVGTTNLYDITVNVSWEQIYQSSVNAANRVKVMSYTLSTTLVQK